MAAARDGAREGSEPPPITDVPAKSFNPLLAMSATGCIDVQQEGCVDSKQESKTSVFTTVKVDKTCRCMMVRAEGRTAAASEKTHPQ